MTSAAPEIPRESHRFLLILRAASALLFIVGVFSADSVIQLIAYSLVLLAALFPSMLWLGLGSPGIPVFPVVTAIYIPYYAWPILRSAGNVMGYSPEEVLQAAITVTMFLLSATLPWFLLTSRKREDNARPKILQTLPIAKLALTGVWAGVVFNFLNLYGYFEWMGALFGTARAVAGTLTLIGCFLVGVARAQGRLTGNSWIAAAVGVLLLILLSWLSLFLVTGIFILLSLALGYVTTSRRIPWLMIAIVAAVVTVLHAGKAEMRAKYWSDDANYGAITSISEVPGFVAEWVNSGFAAIATQSDFQSPLERAGLAHMVLLAQTTTPGRVDYLWGATYALLPDILVPRFIDSSKPASQVGMDLLNVSYGLLTLQGAASTAIGWGLTAEGYANFGYFGVIGIALLLGTLCGLLQVWSQNAALMSLATLTNIAFMMVLINVEADFIALCSSLLQSYAGALISYVILKRFVATVGHSPV